MTSDDTATRRDDATVASPERFRHEWKQSVRPSTAVIEAIAIATDRDPTTMLPLYEFVDADALDDLLAASDGAGTMTVSFAYDDVEIHLDSGGSIEILPDTSDRK